MNETELDKMLKDIDGAILAVIKREYHSTNDGNISTSIKKQDILGLLGLMQYYEKNIYTKPFYETRKQAKKQILNTFHAEMPNIISLQSYSADSGQNKQSVSVISVEKAKKAISILEKQTESGNSVIIWQRG